MADLTAAVRKKMPASQFAEPSKKAFPMPDANHDRLAISGASRSYNAGNISAEEKDRIQSMARQRLVHALTK